MQNPGVQVRHLPVAVPQSGDNGGEHPEVGEKLRMVLPGGLDGLQPPAAGTGEGGEQRVELAEGNGDADPPAGGQGLQRSVQTGAALGVGHRVHQGQGVQQKSGPALRRGGEEFVQPGGDLGEHRARRRQGLQILRRPLEAEVLTDEAGSRHGGGLQPLLYIIKRL